MLHLVKGKDFLTFLELLVSLMVVLANPKLGQLVVLQVLLQQP
jgi:hypothetical protein